MVPPAPLPEVSEPPLPDVDEEDDGEPVSDPHPIESPTASGKASGRAIWKKRVIGASLGDPGPRRKRNGRRGTTDGLSLQDSMGWGVAASALTFLAVSPRVR